MRAPTSRSDRRAALFSVLTGQLNLRVWQVLCLISVFDSLRIYKRHPQIETDEKAGE